MPHVLNLPVPHGEFNMTCREIFYRDGDFDDFGISRFHFMVIYNRVVSTVTFSVSGCTQHILKIYKVDS